MKKITVNILGRSNTYPILIGEGLLSNFEELFDFQKYSKIFVVTDTQIEKALLKNKKQFLPQHVEIIVVPAGERAKTVDTVCAIWKALLQHQADRKSLLINLGGGVISDIGGFAASTFMRGIDFLNIPTTLLAMVDASIGGKTGINFEETKNIIGTFTQPVGVFIDVDVLRSLPKRILTEGFGEIIKHGLIADKKYFEFVISKKPEEFTSDELINSIEESNRIKKLIVENDEKEQGLRKVLNFGHTIGHALEALSQQTTTPLLHGEAVSIGIVAESNISFFAKMLSAGELETIKNALVRAGLPITISGVNKKAVLDKMLSDKKNEKNIMRWTLLHGIGNAKVNQLVESTVVEKALAEVLL